MKKFFFLLNLILFHFCLASDYYTFDKIVDTLHAWQSNYGYSTHPYFSDYGIIYNLDTIGYSSQTNLPILAVKISEDANFPKQDKPRVLILGQCHAEEIYGIEISMEIINCYLNPDTCWDDYNNIREYLVNVLETSLEKVELWIVPTHNPEGLRVVHGYCDDEISITIAECSSNNGNWIEDPTYRKNIHDTNNNDLFLEHQDWKSGVGYDVDGVDLNRNYDINWIFGDELLEEGNSCNGVYFDDYDYYRGIAPFSENEIQAISKLAVSNNFLLSLAYHSSRSGCVAEKIVFPWGWKNRSNSDGERKLSPDYSLIKQLGDEIHQILEFPNAGGAIPQRSRNGNAHDWLYRETGCIQYLIEVGGFHYESNPLVNVPSYYIDPGDELLIDADQDKFHDSIEKNLEAFFYLLINASGESSSGFDNAINLAQVTGIVTDEQNHLLQGVIIKVLERDGLILKPRTTDEFGRFRRLLEIGSSYTLTTSYPGYISDTIYIENLTVGINTYNIELNPQSLYELHFNIQTSYGNSESVNIYYLDSFTSNVLSNVSTLLPEDYYQFRLGGDGFSPVIIQTYLNNNKSFDIQLYEEQILFSDEFVDMSNWEVINGDWGIIDNKLKSQENLLYDNNILYQIKSDIIILEENDNYVLELHLKNELEWEKDYFYLMYVSENDTVPLLSLTGDKYEFYTEYFPLVVSQGQANGHILLSLQTDYNLNYRGVEIENLILYSSGDYNENNLSTLVQVRPNQFLLEQNYPNPFNPTTSINFSVPSMSLVAISIYNIRGKFIEQLVNDIYEPGHYSINLYAEEYASGIYLYRLKADNSIYTKKFIIIK